MVHPPRESIPVKALGHISSTTTIEEAQKKSCCNAIPELFIVHIIGSSYRVDFFLPSEPPLPSYIPCPILYRFLSFILSTVICIEPLSKRAPPVAKMPGLVLKGLDCSLPFDTICGTFFTLSRHCFLEFPCAKS